MRREMIIEGLVNEERLQDIVHGELQEIVLGLDDGSLTERAELGGLLILLLAVTTSEVFDSDLVCEIEAVIEAAHRHPKGQWHHVVALEAVLACLDDEPSRWTTVLERACHGMSSLRGVVLDAMAIACPRVTANQLASAVVGNVERQHLDRDAWVYLIVGSRGPTEVKRSILRSLIPHERGGPGLIEKLLSGDRVPNPHRNGYHDVMLHGLVLLSGDGARRPTQLALAGLPTEGERPGEQVLVPGHVRDGPVRRPILTRAELGRRLRAHPLHQPFAQLPATS